MINNLIQGYALGCLSAEEIEQLRNAINSGQDINLKDIGKYQNLAALLPVSLPLEVPDQNLKEKVARKLYRLRNDNDVKKEIGAGDEKNHSAVKDISREIINRSTTGNSTAERYKRITAQNISLTGESGKSRDFKEVDLNLMPRYKSIRKTTLLMYLGGAVIFGLVVGFLLFYENKNPYVAEISKLNKELQEINNELITNTGVLTMLEKKDTRIFSLSGSEIFPDGYGKVYVNAASKRAYLYLWGIEPLREGTYQLWVTSSGTVYPIGLFNPVKDPGYFYFNFPDIKITTDLKILLTEEPVGGSPVPGRKIHLKTPY